MLWQAGHKLWVLSCLYRCACVSYEDRLRDLGLCWSVEEAALGSTCSSLQYLMGGINKGQWCFTWANRDGIRGHSLKEIYIKCKREMPCEGGETLDQAVQRNWLPHPWKHRRPGWMGLGVTWSSGRCPRPWQGVQLDGLYSPVQPQPLCDCGGQRPWYWSSFCI